MSLLSAINFKPVLQVRSKLYIVYPASFGYVIGCFIITLLLEDSEHATICIEQYNVIICIVSLVIVDMIRCIACNM